MTLPASWCLAWTAVRREAYANDQGAAASLVAVTACTNRQESDQDPAEWLPPSLDARCRYAGDRVATKLRWQLTADATEHEAPKVFAEGPSEDTIVAYTPAPDRFPASRFRRRWARRCHAQGRGQGEGPAGRRASPSLRRRQLPLCQRLPLQRLVSSN
ncbi:hypothetical protein GCM10010392_65040 [Streptomyces clavifer]|nr:hypothetical protein GCM10010392_65040 [Streptomyces clavifer]